MNYPRFKRWLYANGRPNWLARVLNGAWARIHAAGVAPDYLVTLEVVGRRTGKPITFPLVLLRLDGQRYLVSMLGEQAGWVRNVRAAGGQAVMRHGCTEHVVLREVPVAQRACILKAYLGVAPGARPHLSVDKDAPLEAFAPVAAAFPVFRVEGDQSPANGK